MVKLFRVAIARSVEWKLTTERSRYLGRVCLRYANRLFAVSGIRGFE